MEKKRQYSKEFKVSVCELVLKDQLKPKIVAEKMGLNVVMLYRWISEYQQNGDEAFMGIGHPPPAALGTATHRATLAGLITQ